MKATIETLIIIYILWKHNEHSDIDSFVSPCHFGCEARNMEFCLAPIRDLGAKCLPPSWFHSLLLRVTKDNWVTEFVFVSICQQFVNQTRGNTWISPCLIATKNNIQTLMNIPLPHFFCSDRSSPWEKSLCNSDDCNLHLKVQACAQTSDGIDRMRNSPRPPLSCFINSICARNCRKTTDSCRLLSV